MSVLQYIMGAQKYGVPVIDVRGMLIAGSLKVEKIVGNKPPTVKRIKSMVPLLTKAIKTLDLNKSEYKTRILNSPGVRLPNIAVFNVNLNGPNLLMKYYGIEKKLPSSITFIPGKNGNMNRYLIGQVRRLKKYRDAEEYQKYGTLGYMLIKRSNIGRVSAINHVFPKGHRNYPLGMIINLNRRVSKLVNQKGKTMDFKRVYIEKGNKGGRPLGVPKPEGRVLLHMGGSLLTFYLEPKLDKNQHGFIPGKGTLSAWKQIFKQKLYLKPYIMEGDFKNFFGSIDGNRVSAELIKYKVPREIVEFLESVNRSIPKLPEKELIDEGPFKIQLNLNKLATFGFNKPTIKSIHEPTYDSKIDKAGDLLHRHVPQNDDSRNPETVHFKFALMDRMLTKFKDPIKFKGVAQGAPTSPILANLIMDIGLRSGNRIKGFTTIGYADDSITFSDHPIKTNNVYTPQNTGIEINGDKSQLVKRKGRWIGSIKFLGLKFDGKIFQAATRKGSKLIFNKKIGELLKLEQVRLEQGIKLDQMEDVINFVEKRENLSSAEHGSSGREYFNNKLIGFVQSRMYQGSGNLEKLEQDFNLKFTGGSGMGKLGRVEQMDVFNSSSFACKSLANIFRGNAKLRKERSIIIKLSENKVG